MVAERVVEVVGTAERVVEVVGTAEVDVEVIAGTEVRSGAMLEVGALELVALVGIGCEGRDGPAAGVVTAMEDTCEVASMEGTCGVVLVAVTEGVGVVLSSGISALPLPDGMSEGPLPLPDGISEGPLPLPDGISEVLPLPDRLSKPSLSLLSEGIISLPDIPRSPLVSADPESLFSISLLTVLYS